jgi:DMSO/TMAO reductase YedYZ molybdopterin-dependent catalytic subunit
VSLFAIRDGDGPQGVPVNRSAAAAGVEQSAVGADYRLELVNSERSVMLSRADLTAMPQTTVSLPIACVEGWSAMAVWRGVRLRDLLAQLEAPTGSDIYLQSLQQRGAFGTSVLPSQFVDDDLTLIALEVNGDTLDLDHGYPCRLIAPNRPGVRQTKWLSRIEVLS